MHVADAHPTPENDRWTWALLAMLTALGAGLRLIGLDQQSLWNDELSSLIQAGRPSLRHVFATTAPDHVPGYFAMLHVWTRAFGESEIVLRLPSALLGIATIPAMFLLGRCWYGRREGLIAAGVVAVGWMPVYFSQEARPYALLLLAVTLSAACLCEIVRALLRGTAAPLPALLGYVVAATTATYAHYFGLLFVVLQAAVAAFTLSRRPRALGMVAAIYLTVATLYLPCAYRAVKFATPRSAGWLTPPTLDSIWYALRFFFNDWDWLAIAVVALLAVAALRTLARRERPTPETLVLAVWVVLPVAITYVASHVATPSFLPRTLMIVAPGAYLLLARALTQLPLTAVSAPAVLVVLLGHLVVGRQYYTKPTKGQFREAVAYLVAGDAPDTPALVLACTWHTRFFDYYLERLGSPRRIARLVDTAADVDAVEALIAERGARDVWLLEGHKRCDPSLIAALTTRLRLVEEQRLIRTAAWHFRL